jgi:nucleoside-diphosphate-sugar epimerase
VKVLITGITGFVGSHLLNYITINDLGTVYGLKRPRSPMDNIHSQVELLDCDVTDYHSVQAIIDTVKPDRIFHLAAQSYVPLS